MFMIPSVPDTSTTTTAASVEGARREIIWILEQRRTARKEGLPQSGINRDDRFHHRRIRHFPLPAR